MGDIDIDIDIDEASVERVEEKLQDAIREGSKTTRDNLLSIGQKEARRVITQRDAVWRGQLLESISKKKEPSNQYEISGKVYTNSSHARPIEFGAEYNDGVGPNIENLIPWVRDHFSFNAGGDFTYDHEPDTGVDYAVPLDREIAGDKNTSTLAAEKWELNTGNGTWVEKDTYDNSYYPNSFQGQKLIGWDARDEEYKEFEVRGFTGQTDSIPTIEWDGDVKSIEKFLYYFTTDPDRNNDIVWAEFLGDLSQENHEEIVKKTFMDTPKAGFNARTSDIIGFNEAVEEGLNRHISNLLDETRRRKLVKGIGKIDKYSDTPQEVQFGPNDKIPSGYADYSAGGLDELFVNYPKLGKADSVSTSIHEHQHFADFLVGWQMNGRAKDKNIGSKAEEFKNLGQNEALYFRYLSNNYQGEPNHQNQYVAAEQYFLGDSSSTRIDHLLHMDSRMEEEVKNSVDTLKSRSYDQDIPQEAGDFSAGDYVKIYSPQTSTGEDVEARVVSVTTNQNGEPVVNLMTDRSSRWRFVMPEDSLPYMKNENDLITRFDDIKYTSGDGSKRDYLSFLESTRQSRMYEAINRAWLRQALAAEIYPLDNSGDEKRRAGYYLTDSRYSSSSAGETSTKAMELWLGGPSLANDPTGPYQVGSLYQNHPDLFYALSEVYSPSDEFKEALKEDLGIEYEEALRRVTP
jgi:hypothetical protein